MFSKKYNLINNVTGWCVFVIALITYWLTLEPTASYWDCGEFIIQADKLEVGHPPGNPIFMLTARFFANFAPDITKISVMVNAMSGLLSALTILLLFWTITHLTRRLVVRDGQTAELSLSKYLVIMGSGVVGALAYCWSDTFWFSAVEGEVYAFSSFCTALVFWLILKWENRVDLPHSDRYLILIAYIVGVSVAVHLLNLLCIPAIVLVFAYRKWKDMNLVKSLLALLVSFAIIVLVLYGLVPGFIKMAQQFELVFVNKFGFGYNSGALWYAIVTAAVFIWALYEIRSQRSAMRIKLSFFCSVLLSGMLFIGSGWWLGWILLAILLGWLVSKYSNPLPLRVLSVITWSIVVIFIGYSSYALILIRSNADTPMNQNSPDNVFDLASYLNREQYGENPLLYGETLYSSAQKLQKGVVYDTITYREDGSPVLLAYPIYDQNIGKGKAEYTKGIKGEAPAGGAETFLTESDRAENARLAARGKDYYAKKGYKSEVKMAPEQNMLFPRIYSRMHRDLYGEWVTLDTTAANIVTISAIDEKSGEKIPELDLQAEPYMNPATGTVMYPQKQGYKPTFAQNLQYFLNYQLNHMYMRYFMWNFAGRQNDVMNQSGELDAGNWISGIGFIDNARLGDQKLLPAELGSENAGHNKYYMLPLILGLIGLIWQAFAGKRGIEQFWVIFFLFFMTGIAIVLYLNQPPGQPRERDYAFAGSFYAYAVWIGMGVAGLWSLLRTLMKGAPKLKDSIAENEDGQSKSLIAQPEGKEERPGLYAAVVACVIGLVIPLQMVSQTWDDHDRSGRYAARDFGVNYLESLEPNAIVFCNGDNDTFPLWYAQEVEGVRPDVKIVNLSYLNSEWYANQMRQQSYEAAPIEFTAVPGDYAYGKADVTVLGRNREPADLLSSLKAIYQGKTFNASYNYPEFPSQVVTIPVDRRKVIERGLVAPEDTAEIVNEIVVDLGAASAIRKKGYVSLGELLMLDIIATNAANGWERPIYWCSTVGPEYSLGMANYLRSTGMTHQLVPTYQEGVPARADRAYDNIKNKYRWGGADVPADKAPYYDETARRMLVSVRSSILDTATELIYQGDLKATAGNKAAAENDYKKAAEMIKLMETKLPASTSPYTMTIAVQLPELYGKLGTRLGKSYRDKAVESALDAITRYAPYVAYNIAMRAQYGNPAMTTESTYMPYQLWSIIEIYNENGGSTAKLDEILSRYNLTRDQLRNFHNMVYGGGVDAGQTGGHSEAEYIAELSHAAKIVNELAGLSASDYAARSADDKLLDSIFYDAYEQYKAYGISDSVLMADPEIKRVNMDRSRRLHEQYKNK